MTESTKAFAKAFSGYSLGVLLSHISGMFRDIALAFFFGTSSELALFMVAYRFANLMRRMLAESPLASSFIPLFASLKGPQEEGRFFRDVFFSFALIAAALVACGMGGLFWGGKLFMGDVSEVSQLTQIMLPSLFFICLYGVCSSFLQCEKKFFLPAVAPVAFNVVWILAAWGAYRSAATSSMRFLSYGVIVAFAMQWLLLMPEVMRILRLSLTWQECSKPRPFHSALKGMVKPFILGTLGIGAAQINIALDSIFARIADPEGPALLWYAIRIEQVPVALFGVAIASAILPTLTRTIQQGSEKRELLIEGVKQTFSLMSFSMFGLFALGYLTVSLLFGHGKFQGGSIAHTTTCLYSYALGLIPHGLTLLLASVYYAHKDFKTPMRASLLAVACNAILNAIMVFVLHWGAESIALGTSLTSAFNGWYLYHRLKSLEESSFSLGLFYLKTLLCGAAACFCVWLCKLAQGSQFVMWGVGVCVYMGSYLLFEKLLGCQQLTKIVQVCIKKAKT